MQLRPTKKAFAWILDTQHQSFLKMFQKKGGEGRFVGSAVRDSLLGLPIHDFDVATTLLPAQVKELFEEGGHRVLPTGLDHGTVTVLFKGTAYEVTTLRQDIKTDGRHAKVVFTTVWEEDAARRDFTINALYLDAQGHVHDYFQGVIDLKNSCVRFIGDATKRVHEDFLRILRFFRFSARYGNGVFHTESLQACIQLKGGVKTLSYERVLAEIRKIFAGPFLQSIASVWIQKHFFEALGCVVDGKMRTLEILSMLLKAQSLDVFSENNIWLLRLKSVLGRNIPPFLLERAQKKWWHNIETPPSNPFIILEKQFYVWCYKEDTKLAVERLCLQLARKVAKGEMRFQDALHLLKDLSCKTEKQHLKPFPLSGSDIENLGVGAGPQRGALLERALFYWIDSGFSGTKKDLMTFIEKNKPH